MISRAKVANTYPCRKPCY